MRFHRVWFLAIALSVGIFMLAPAASAWEINLDGNYTWQYEYRSGLGTAGFFGPFDIDNGATTAVTSENGWLGSQANYDQMVSGADGSWNIMYMTTNMDLRINPALRVRGQYYIGSWAVPNSGLAGATGGYAGGTPSAPLVSGGVPVASWSYNYTAPGVQRSFSPGYWNTLWLTAQLPWGTLTLGKRGSIFGTGLAWNGVENRSSESTSLTAAYGPLRIGLSLYVAREGDEGYYNRFADKNNLRLYDTALPTLTYRDGPLDVGVLFNWVRRHNGPEKALVAPGPGTATNPGKNRIGVRDREDFYGGIYAKYNNGRFFFNTEFDWYDRLDRVWNRTGATATASTRYVQDYRLMAELGVMAGPTKVALMASWLNGNDRRAGVVNNINQGLITNQISSLTTANTVSAQDFRWQQASLSNTGLYRPYSYLMVYSYGTGPFVNLDTNNGYVADAMTYAARVDYAVAANLNVYGSFFWADRVGNGYGWGYLAPDPNAFGATGNTGTGRVTGAYRGGTTVGTAARNIPDNNLGWEVDGGFDWKLLEGLLVNATFAYWQPGKWFNYACIDKLNPGWNTPNTGNNWGTIPDRKIDPIFGMEIKVSAEF